MQWRHAPGLDVTQVEAHGCLWTSGLAALNYGREVVFRTPDVATRLIFIYSFDVLQRRVWYFEKSVGPTAWVAPFESTHPPPRTIHHSEDDFLVNKLFANALNGRFFLPAADKGFLIAV